MSSTVSGSNPNKEEESRLDPTSASASGSGSISVSAPTNSESGTEAYALDDVMEKDDKVIPTTSKESVQVLDNIPKRAMPNANVPEKIILCIDCCQSENAKSFEIDANNVFPPLAMLKRITEFFLYSKQAISNNSEFALIVLKENEPIWVRHFTRNVIEIVIALDSFDSEICKSSEFDLSLLFNMIKDKVTFQDMGSDYKLVPPNNVVRLILVYNRSSCIPKFMSGSRVCDLLKKHPYFTIDVLFAHEENCSEHKCEAVYDALQTLDNGYSYIFEVAKSTSKIHECNAKLLAHPLQRPFQKDTSYVF